LREDDAVLADEDGDADVDSVGDRGAGNRGNSPEAIARRRAVLEDAAATLIQHTQTLLVDQIGGTFGLVFAVAATAFFVPRMVEKGAADTIFSSSVQQTATLIRVAIADPRIWESSGIFTRKILIQ
jgi:hypothetical protein